MIKRDIFILLFFAVFLHCSQDNRSITGEKQITKIVKNFHDAFDKKDFAALAALCSKDMYWYTLNGKALHPSDFSSFFRPMMANWRSVKTSINDLEIKMDKNFAVARYKSQFDFVSPAGQNHLHNLHTMVFIRQDARWKIWQHQMSAK